MARQQSQAEMLHLYRDGHVQHNWEQSRFLKEVFEHEDGLRAEAERYGQGGAVRSTMLDWRREPASARGPAKGSARGSARDSARGSAKGSARGSARSSARASVCQCGASARTATSRSGASSRCSCSQCGGAAGESSSRLSWGSVSSRTDASTRSDSTARVERLQDKKRMLEAQLRRLEAELGGLDIIGEEDAPSTRSGATARASARPADSSR